MVLSEQNSTWILVSKPLENGTRSELGIAMPSVRTVATEKIYKFFFWGLFTAMARNHHAGIVEWYRSVSQCQFDHNLTKP